MPPLNPCVGEDETAVSCADLVWISHGDKIVCDVGNGERVEAHFRRFAVMKAAETTCGGEGGLPT